MIKKYQALVAASICLASVSSFAGLTLCGQNNKQIDVQCNNNWSPAPIPANGCASFAGTSNLDWRLIAGAIMGAPSGVCNFITNKGTANQTTVGTANVVINTASNTGTLSNINYDAGNYTLNTGDYVQGTPAANVTITIIGKASQ